jgi:hypothetical protein
MHFRTTRSMHLPLARIFHSSMRDCVGCWGDWLRQPRGSTERQHDGNGVTRLVMADG